MFRTRTSFQFILCCWAVIVSTAPALGQDADGKRSVGKTDSDASDEASSSPTLREMARMSLEQVTAIAKSGRNRLARITGAETALDQNMRTLQEVVAAAAERARRLSQFDIEALEADAEARFDASIKAIREYLNLVADDGPVHESAKRVRAAALDRQTRFEVKAQSKHSQRYSQLGAPSSLEMTGLLTSGHPNPHRCLPRVFLLRPRMMVTM